MIDVDDIWQKYSEDSRIESAFFSFHVGVVFVNFLNTKLLFLISAHCYIVFPDEISNRFV